MNSLTTFLAAALVLFAFGQALAAKAAEPVGTIAHGFVLTANDR